MLYYDGLGWADERKTLAEDEGGNTNPDNYNDAGVGSSDDETSVGNLVTIKGDFVSDAAEVSCAFTHLNRSLTSLLPLSISFFPLFSYRGRGLPGREILVHSSTFNTRDLGSLLDAPLQTSRQLLNLASSDFMER